MRRNTALLFRKNNLDDQAVNLVCFYFTSLVLLASKTLKHKLVRMCFN